MANDSPCKGVKIGFSERIAAQGVFGIFTPEAKSSYVKEVYQELYQQRRKYADGMRDKPLTKAGQKEKSQNQFMTLKALAFHADEVCMLLKKRNITTVSIACEADTEPGTEDTGKYSHPRFIVECFLAPGDLNKVDFDEFKRNKIGSMKTEKSTAKWEISASSLIDDVKTRKELYSEAISEIFKTLYYHSAQDGEFLKAESSWMQTQCEHNDDYSKPNIEQLKGKGTKSSSSPKLQ